MSGTEARRYLRYFYQQHERLMHYLVLEEISDYLRQNPHFQDYSEDMLEQDLNQLVNWKNLVPRQDTCRVSSIEEFKKRKSARDAKTLRNAWKRSWPGLGVSAVI